jgi:uncharacterized DUF497 family protein
MLDLSRFTTFEWDAGNDVKNWTKHRVSRAECEEIFFHRPLLLQEDASHSTAEARCYVLGKTSASHKLFLVFTARGDRIRVISARDMTRAERRRYLHEEG